MSNNTNRKEPRDPKTFERPLPLVCRKCGYVLTGRFKLRRSRADPLSKAPAKTPFEIYCSKCGSKVSIAPKPL